MSCNSADPLSDSYTSQTYVESKSTSNSCIYCQKFVCSAKYRRHLVTHVKNGQLSVIDVQKILYRSRKIRKDIQNKAKNITQLGYTCHFVDDLGVGCNHIVLNLNRHLKVVHKLDNCCSKFEELIARSSAEKPLERKTKLTCLRDNPITTSGSCIDNSKKDLVSSSSGFPYNVTNFQLSNSNETTHLDTMSGIYELSCISSSNSDSDSNSFSDCPLITEECDNRMTRNKPIVESCSSLPSISMSGNSFNLTLINQEKLIKLFHSFLLTKGGGGRRFTPTKGDISNFRSLIKGIGLENFWNPNSLNEFVSTASCTASTTYTRLRVYERFIHFLRVQFPFMLPCSETIKAIESMLVHLKEALGKDRHLRSKTTMAASRERIPISFDVLRQWRVKRHTIDVKTYFNKVVCEPACLTESLFLQIRNYLIVEIILANAQRSGIIEGMLISEVLEAKNNRNSDNLHYIYITNHKTGHIQPAIIYLEAEIYTHLSTFVTKVLSLLPSADQPRNSDNSRVFQTWHSAVLRTNTISSCLRAGLKLFGISDPNGCPTHYRKAASTLISMHNPSMQESLSQFMCHARSTTERHYRHHMSHRGLYSVFTELAKCQAMPEGHIPNTNLLHGDDTLLSAANSIEPSASITDMNSQSIRINNISDTDVNHTENLFVGDSEISSDTPVVSLPSEISFEGSPPSEILTDSGHSEDNTERSLKNSKYSRKRNGKSIFDTQNQENSFFLTFGKLIDKSLARVCIRGSEVLELACGSEEFMPIWEQLISQYGQQLALKKVCDKIRTFARNHRDRLFVD